MIVNTGKYYLYRHIRVDTNEVFYIGIGTKQNVTRIRGYKTEYSRAFCKQSRGRFWKNTTLNNKYEVEILLESNDYEFIKRKEIEFIKLYGRRDLGTGTLVNTTDGGDGTLGRKCSESQKIKIGRANKGNKYSLGVPRSLESRKVKDLIISYKKQVN